MIVRRCFSRAFDATTSSLPPTKVLALSSCQLEQWRCRRGSLTSGPGVRGGRATGRRSDVVAVAIQPEQLLPSCDVPVPDLQVTTTAHPCTICIKSPHCWFLGAMPSHILRWQLLVNYMTWRLQICAKGVANICGCLCWHTPWRRLTQTEHAFCPGQSVWCAPAADGPSAASAASASEGRTPATALFLTPFSYLKCPGSM